MRATLQSAVMLACLGLAAAGAHAQTAWPKIDAKDWQLASSTDDKRFYIKPMAPGPRHPRLLIRFETRDAVTAEELTYRSMLEGIEFNCAKNSLRLLMVGVYGNNNLKGLVDSDTTAGAWKPVKPDTYEALASKVACADFVPAARTPVWPAIRKGDWQLIEDEDDAKTYALPEQGRAYPRAWLRTEYVEAQEFNNRAFRSSRSLLEFDCKKRRARASLGIQYPQNNLQGVADMSGAMGEWQEPDLGSPEDIMGHRLCDAEAQAPAAADPEGLGAKAVAQDAQYKGVETLDWTPFGVLPRMRLFVQAANGGVYPQVLVRIEFIDAVDLGEMKARSLVTKFEVDCAERRVREKAFAAYAGANLKGKGMNLTDPEADWRSMDKDEKLPIEALEPLCDLRLGGDKADAAKPAPEAAPPAPGVAKIPSPKAAA